MNFIETDMCGHAKTVTNGLYRLFKIATTLRSKQKILFKKKTEFQPHNEEAKEGEKKQQIPPSQRNIRPFDYKYKVLLRIVPEARANKPKCCVSEKADPSMSVSVCVCYQKINIFCHQFHVYFPFSSLSFTDINRLIAHSRPPTLPTDPRRKWRIPHPIPTCK